MKVIIYDEKRLNGPDNLCNKGAVHIESIDLKGYNMYVEQYPYVQRGNRIIKADIFEVSDNVLAELDVIYEEKGMEGKLCFYNDTLYLIFLSNTSYPEDLIEHGDYLKYLEDLYKFEEFKQQINERA